MKRHFVYALSLLAMIAVSCDDDDKNDPTTPVTPPAVITDAQFAGEDLLGKGLVSLERNKNTKTAFITVNMTGDWQLYAGPTVDDINFKDTLLSGSGELTDSLKITVDTRSYFQFVHGEDMAILAERHLPMTGKYNFRDLGGFRTTDGKHVKWGLMFRSDELNAELTEADYAYLNSIPLTSIIDFRSAEEKEAEPDVPPTSVKNVYELELGPGNLAGMSVPQILGSTEAELDEIMVEMNREFVTDSICIAQYTHFFDYLEDEANLPLIFHCSAGKDRTGMGSFLFLSSLGVDEETIMDDYLFSNDCLREKYEKKYGKDAFEAFPQLNVLTGVKREYLQTAIDQIKTDHGTIENYLTSVLGADIEKMKSIYLY